MNSTSESTLLADFSINIQHLLIEDNRSTQLEKLEKDFKVDIEVLRANV